MTANAAALADEIEHPPLHVAWWDWNKTEAAWSGEAFDVFSAGYEAGQLATLRASERMEAVEGEWPPVDDVARLRAALRRAITTASNDDVTKPGTEDRTRHAERLTAMIEAAGFLDALAHGPNRDGVAEERGALDRLVECLADDTNDCIDNHGQPYQSQGLADAISRARAAIRSRSSSPDTSGERA